ncbi:MAG: ABC transporter substrate-binding protein [Deltaproteobacteria bacterium]|nr:ABC transporter substrate-binding protein [Deltaproteobacteria bacterium]
MWNTLPIARKLGFLVVPGLLFLSVRTMAKPLTPTAFVKKETRKVRTILKRRPRKNTRAYQRKKDDLRNEVDSLIDFKLLAKRSLRDFWDKLKEDKRDKFVRLLKDLVQESYMSRIDENPNFKMIYKEEKKLSSGKAIVRSVAKKGKTEVEIAFKLIPKDNSWIVYDMVIDDVSVERNYRRQFKKIINKHGFDGLLEKMENKLKELRNGKKAAKPGKGDDL